MDTFKIDSHKLIYHVDRVNSWQKGHTVAPIYLEAALSGGCNHRCIFCALDYMGYETKFIDTKTLKRTIKEASSCGVKSMMYAGEGEPLLHKDVIDIVNFTKNSGIDVAMTTNGVLLNQDVIKNCLKSFSWIRVSFNAGSPKAYQKAHRCHAGDFEKTIDNLKEAVRFKKANKLSCVIGVQMLLIQENKGEAIKLARILKKTGVDYLIIKPFSKHPMSRNKIDRTLDYSKLLYLDKKLQKIAAKDFNIIFRAHAMDKLKEGKPYRHCLGLPFWAYIDAEGNMYACSAYLGNKKFAYGNIYKENFCDIVHSKKRKNMVRIGATKLNTDKCREICRLDEINRYLWELKYPGPHVNFI